MITQSYNLNLIPSGVPLVVHASQYDKTSRTLEFTLYKGDELFSIPSGSTVEIMGTKLDNTGYVYSCTFSGSVVSVEIQEQMTVLAGKYQAEIRIYNDGDILGSANFVFDIERAGLSDDTIISDTDLPLIEEAIEKADEVIALMDTKMEYVSNPTANDILLTDSNGQAIDSGESITSLKSYSDTQVDNAVIEIGRRTRKNITNNLTNLTQAIAEQNLEKYGYAIGDYFVGASGYYYYLADMDTNYGGYTNQAVVNTHHCGIVVDTKSNTPWLSSGSITNYSSSTLHSFLTNTALPNIKSDITALFGDWSSHLLSRTELDNAVGGWGTTWTGLANCLICAMSEVQFFGAIIFGCDGYQTGTCSKPLELFRKFRYNEIYGNVSIWLKSIYSASYACLASRNGNADASGVAYSGRASGLILFH